MHFIVPNTAQPEINFHLCVVENGNYTANSTYQANLKYLLNSVYSNTEIDYGFYNFSYGESPDKVYAIGLCRGDVKPGACRDCLNYSSLALTSLCPTQKEAIIGLDNCILRYASRYIFGLNEVAPYFFVYSLTNVSDEKGFNRSLNSLLDSLQDEAAAGDPRRKYATGKISTDAPNFQTIYALSQCTPDLSQAECSSCLRNASARVGQCCQERQGGRVIYPSCNFRYEINQFYEIPIGEDPSPPTSKGIYPEKFSIITWENWNSGPNLDKLIDPTLRAGSRNEMLRCIHVGLLCVQENAPDRPNMASVVIMLSSYSVTLPVPQKPAFFARSTELPGTTSTWTESDQSRSASVPCSINEASISELYPR
uniref:Putative receptor-like protein kinase n=1 Tax=Populus alba TaxID=43335 RepID=A0A4U5NL04_POPAL|nr:putative receptor-like protein kinase [Populus alba]